MKLTLKQKKFADNYIISGNATEAAIKAGYSKKTAQQIGAENLLKPVIKFYIDERLKKIEAERYLDIEEALRLTASIARGEPRRTIIKDPFTGKLREKLTYPSFRDSNTSLEHFYRINGKFTDKQEIELAGSVQFLDDIE